MKRELRLIDLTFAIVSGIIGSSWLLASQVAANMAGPSAIISWVIGGVAICLLALTYAELGSMLPEPGGSVRYPQYSHGSLVSFVIGWGAWLSWVTTPPAEAEAITQYANTYVHHLYNTQTGLLTFRGLLMSAVLTAAFALINYYGVRLFARVNTALTFFKFIVPALTAVLLIAAGFHKGNFSHYGGFFPHGIQATLMAIGSCGIIFALQGFRQAIELSGEARNPQRDVARATVLGVAICVVIYIILQFAFIGALAPADIIKGWGGLSMSAPFAQLAVALNLGWLAILLRVDAWVSPSGTGLVFTATTARGIFAMAENGYLPKGLMKIHPRWKIPANAILFNLIIGLLCLAPFSSWSKLIGFISVTGVISYLLGPVAASVLRRTAPDLPRPIRIGGLSLIAPLAFIVAGLIVYWTGWPSTLYALGAVVAGLLIYFYYFFRGSFEVRHVRSGIWLMVYLVAIIFCSYIGDKSFGGKGLLKFPGDTLVVAALSIAAYYWGVLTGYETGDIKEVVDETAPSGAHALS
ncbi:aspartate:proton symporter [Desulfotomaculum copahuensis]|uniref:Aspartate:proton symporter n=2 Tax=Desulfotomaculum copahuensis TaxID=1838280 RepID=A0A1B7LCQ3_9FIRM|nr:aspartate:proton symporter [Desulfotomaculum copahuensis]